MKSFMKVPLIFGMAVVLLPVVITPVPAAPIKQVLDACDKMANRNKSCYYTINGVGDISGCVKGGDCFYCPNDGKRECVKAKNQPSGNMTPSRDLPRKSGR